MKQTAVEWLVQQLRQLAHNPKTHLGMGDIRVTQGYIDEIEKQAKQMEAEQKIDVVLTYAKAHGFIGLVEELEQLKNK